MNQRSILLSILPGLIVSTSFPAGYRTQTGNASKEDLHPYTFRVPVDEISFKFHAYDSRGFPLTNLTRGDLALSDNGRPQHRIVMLQSLVDLPIRAGFVFDISQSMLDEIPFNRAVISMYASRLLRPDTDRAFVMQFDTEPLITQGWTNSDGAIAAGADAVGAKPSRLVPFTAIFDSLYITCRDQWTQNREETTGNFILLFSDGLDNASHVYLSEAVDMCQRSGTAIYVIVNGRKSRSSEGQRTLNDLASQTGGSIFFKPRGDQMWRDLQIIEAQQRNQYRFVYKPSDFKADGTFHHFRLESSVKGAKIIIRSGYYAFPRQ